MDSRVPLRRRAARNGHLFTFRKLHQERIINVYAYLSLTKRCVSLRENHREIRRLYLIPNTPVYLSDIYRTDFPFGLLVIVRARVSDKRRSGSRAEM